MTRRSLAFLIAVLALGALALPADATVSITSNSCDPSPVAGSDSCEYYYDWKNGYSALYLAFKVEAAGEDFPDLWATLDTSGADHLAVVADAWKLRARFIPGTPGTWPGTPATPPLPKLGVCPTNGAICDPAGAVPARVFFFLVELLKDPEELPLPVGDQVLTLRAYSSEPATVDQGGALATQDFTFTLVDTIQANANKVDTVVTLPENPQPGQFGQITVTGHTGTIGEHKRLYFSPITDPNWPPYPFQIICSDIAWETTADPPNYPTANYPCTLRIPSAEVADTDHDYLATYYFIIDAGGTASTSPVAYIASGQQTKHTVPETTGIFDVFVCDDYTIAPASVPVGVLGVLYPTQTFSAVNGAHTYVMTHAWSAGAAPGMALDNTAMTLSGTPTTAGTYPFSVTMTYTEGEHSCEETAYYVLEIPTPGCGAYTITVAPPSIPSGTVGTAYNAGPFTASGSPVSGTNYTFSLFSGAVEPNLAFSPTLPTTTPPTLGGTPLTSGPFSFTIQATDQNNPPCTGTRAYALQIDCPSLSLGSSPTPVPDGVMGSPFPATQFTATGGVAPYTYTLQPNGVTGLPNGLNLAADGSLAGTPLEWGAFTFRVRALDSAGCAVSAVYNTYICGPLDITPSSLPGGLPDAAYNQMLTAVNAGVPLEWGSSGLPAGLALVQTEPITGTLTASIIGNLPSVDDVYPFTVMITDTGGCMASRQYSITVATPEEALEIPLLGYPALALLALLLALIGVFLVRRNL